MGLELKGLIEKMIREGQFKALMGNPLAQFGNDRRRFLGPQLLPERRVDENSYTEQGIKYRTVIANAGTAYSPVQLKGTTLTGSMDVKLAHSDIGAEFTGSDYDALLAMLRQSGGADNLEMRAMSELLNWATKAVLLPLLELNEKDRWECIEKAQVTRQGDNEYEEVCTYTDPSGHRFNAAEDWSDANDDPLIDLEAAADILIDKGLQPRMLICRRTVSSTLAAHPKMAGRFGILNITDGVVSGLPNRLSITSLNNLLQDNELPPITRYDLKYRTQDSSDYFISEDVMIMIGTTNRDENIDLGDDERLAVPEVLGYTAIGRNSGKPAPGRSYHFEEFETKPPRIEGEGVQCSLPVVVEPEAIVVIKNINIL